MLLKFWNLMLSDRKYIKHQVVGGELLCLVHRRSKYCSPYRYWYALDVDNFRLIHDYLRVIKDPRFYFQFCQVLYRIFSFSFFYACCFIYFTCHHTSLFGALHPLLTALFAPCPYVGGAGDNYLRPTLTYSSAALGGSTRSLSGSRTLSRQGLVCACAYFGHTVYDAILA